LKLLLSDILTYLFPEDF